MKKIFAIALALVMVLSMASAFAAANLPGSCSWGTWDCTTYTAKCGVAKAEVVKFIRTNDCDPFVESDCAAVVKGERVYFGVKVVFEENVNKEWFEHVATLLKLSYTDLYTDAAFGTAVADADYYLDSMGKTYDDVKKGGTFWVTKNGQLVKDFDAATCVREGYAKSTGVKVCANVAYKFDGKTGVMDFGKYTVEYVTDTSVNANTGMKSNYLKVTDVATKDVALFDIGSGKLMGVEVAGNKIYNAYAGGKFYGIDYSNNAVKLITDGETCSYLPAMMQFLGLEFGTCVTDDGVKAFLGWDDDDAFKACATWSKNASSIVDAECVVAIPKTGDASVLAWLF